MASAIEPVSSLDHDRQMEMQLSCSVCLELFTDPVMLSCLHSLCRRCVEKLTDKGKVVSHTVKCPECNSSTDLGPPGHKSLKRNFPLSSMVAIYRQSARHKSRNSVAMKPGDLPSVREGSSNTTQQQPKVTNGNMIPPTVHQTRHFPQQTPESEVPERNVTSDPQINVASSMEPTQPQEGDLITFEETAPTPSSPPPPPPPPPNREAQTDSHEPRVEISMTCSTCEVGKQRKSDVFCETCSISFCQYCLDGYHPDGMGHSLIPVAQEQTQLESNEPETAKQCPICDPASPRPPTVRCLECEMSFCDQCLQNFHPSSKTIPGHTLVEIRANSLSNQLQLGQIATGGTGGAGARGTGTGAAGGEGGGSGGVGKSDIRRSGGQTSRLSGSSIDSFGGGVDIGGLAQLAVKFPCSKCTVKPAQDATYKCLDCCSYMCGGCAHVHQLGVANHSLMDIRLDSKKQTAATLPTRMNPPQPPKEPVNVQLKLVELMGIRAEAMNELLKVLEQRKHLLENHGL